MFCYKCGKQIPEDSVFCPGCGTNQNRTAASAATPPAYTPPVYTAPPAYVPPAYVPPAPPTLKDYQKRAEWAPVFLAIGLVLPIVAVVLFAINVWTVISPILCLAAEMILLIPNTRVQSLFKRHNAQLDKATYKAELKAIKKQIGKNNLCYRLCFAAAFIALAFLIGTTLVLP